MKIAQIILQNALEGNHDDLVKTLLEINCEYRLSVSQKNNTTIIVKIQIDWLHPDSNFSTERLIQELSFEDLGKVLINLELAKSYISNNFLDSGKKVGHIIDQKVDNSLAVFHSGESLFNNLHLYDLQMEQFITKSAIEKVKEITNES